MTINLRDEFINKYNMENNNILEKQIDNVTFIYIYIIRGFPTVYERS